MEYISIEYSYIFKFLIKLINIWLIKINQYSITKVIKIKSKYNKPKNDLQYIVFVVKSR